jgi:DNA-binding NarL/FixJ family response regulator
MSSPDVRSIAESATRNEPRAISVILADALPLVREGIAALCEANGFRVVGQCDDGAAALRLIKTLRPAVALIDIDVPELFALEVVREAVKAGLPTRCIILSTRQNRKAQMECLRSGACGFLVKTVTGRQLAEAIRAVTTGEVFVAPLIRFEEPHSKAADAFESLSSREYEVFTMLVSGLRPKEIGGRLGLSPKTINTYRVNLMRKLQIHDVAGLVRFALEQKLIG